MSNRARRTSKDHLPAGAPAIVEADQGVDPCPSALRTQRARPGRSAEWCSGRGFEPATCRLQGDCTASVLPEHWGDQRGLNSHLRVHSATCRPLHHGHHNWRNVAESNCVLRVCSPPPGPPGSRSDWHGRLVSIQRGPVLETGRPAEARPHEMAPGLRLERRTSTLTGWSPCP